MVSAKVCRSFQGMFFTHFSVETIPTRFCWLNCRKQKAVQSEISQRELFVPISRFWQFGQVSVYYFMSILIICKCRSLHLSSSLMEVPLHCDLLRKRIDFKKDIVLNNWIVLAVRYSVKYFFHTEFPDIPEKNMTQKQKHKTEKSNCRTLCFSSKRNKKVLPATIKYFRRKDLNKPIFVLQKLSLLH